MDCVVFSIPVAMSLSCNSTPGITAPDGSRTIPRRAVTVICADTGPDAISTTWITANNNFAIDIVRCRILGSFIVVSSATDGSYTQTSGQKCFFLIDWP